jgi:hypothetical protein
VVPMSEEKKETKRGRFIACVAVVNKASEEDDNIVLVPFGRLFKSERSAQREIYEWLKREYMGNRDTRNFLAEKDDDCDLEALVAWLSDNKDLCVEYETQELDDD